MDDKASSWRAVILSVTLGLACQACAPRVETTAKVQAKAPEAAELRRVAVMGFQGPEAAMADATFETMLVTHQYDGQPYFTVVDRRQTHAIMGEHARSLSGDIDPRTASRFGKQLGVEGVYFGDIMSSGVTRSSSEGTERYCRRFSSSGRNCRDWGTRAVRCLDRTARVTVMPRLVDVDTGRVVYRAEHVGESSASSCGRNAASSDQELLEEALRQALESVRGDIAPREVKTWVSLMSEPSALGPIDTADFNRGLVFARAQRLDRACEIWRALNARIQGVDNAVLFNVAMCSEVEGDAVTALRIVEDVDRRLDAPDGTVNMALARLRSTAAAQ